VLFGVPARFVAGWIVDDHTPLAQVPTVALGYLVPTAVFAVFFRVLIMWIYNGSGLSVILVGLFHSAFNITIGNQVMPELLNLPASQTSLMCLGVVAVLAVVVVVFTRGRLGYQGRPAGAVGVAAQPKVG
jgi:CAAX protease family protein